MVGLLTQDWLDRQRDASASLPERPGCSAEIEWTVEKAPGGEVVFTTTLEDGRITANRLGGADEPDFSMRMPYPVFREVAAGTLAPDVGFMQGRIKVVGDIGRLLSVLPVTTSPEWRAAVEALAAETDPA